MSPIDYAGNWELLRTRLDAAGFLDRGASIEPALAGITSLGDLAAVVHTGGDRLHADEILGALVRLAAADGGGDEDALLVLLHLLGNGARAVARQLRDLSPDIDGLVAGELTLRIRAFPWRRRRRAYAANLLMDTRRGLLRELKPYRTRLGVDRVILVDPTGPEAEAGLLGRNTPDAGDEEAVTLVDVLLWAERTGVVDADDVALLVELEQAGRGGIAVVATRFGVNERTVRRRRDRALSALRSASSRYLAVAA
jgi:hypothetical protein